VRIVLFLLILLAGSALVAAAGDRMGHLAARRKVRFAGLRPRTVSTIIAVASGLIIMLVTLAAMLLIWSDFRAALSDYDKVKGQLAEVEASLGEMGGKLSKAERDLASAQENTEKAEAQRLQAQQELSKMQAQLIEITKSLSTTQQNLSRSYAQVQQAKAQKAKLDKDIAAYQARVDELRGLVGQAREEAQQGDIVLLKDTVLRHVRIPKEKSSQAAVLIQRALNLIGEVLAKDGLTLAGSVTANANSFIANYPYANSDAMVVITATNNVFKGGETELSFDAQPLDVLVPAGSQVLEIIIGDSSATVRMSGAGERQFNLPAQLTLDSLEQLTVEVYQVFQQGAESLGFLPDLATGEVANPVLKIADISNELLKRQRPIRLQFITRSAVTALDGLADCELYVSGPSTPVGPKPPVGPPVPEQAHD
jgi:hypothetical protein